MCGICGFTYGDEALIKKMCKSIGHRGPDDEGAYVTDSISLGHRRLSILDLSEAGHQPMFSENGRHIIVHNGEVYNFMEVRKELEAKGHRFSSHSDTEVILSAYKEWGKDCIKRFRGMFAFAIWDIEKKELFAVRDRLGIKPFYYMEKGGELYFASEIKALLETGKVKETLHSGALDLYFTFRFTPGEQTVLNDVKKLEPGHWMIWKRGKLDVCKYWDVEPQVDVFPVKRPEREYVEEFLHIFRDAVRLRLVSDVPVGAYLSGGLDSSFIVGMMAAVSDKSPSTFSVGFPDGTDESSYSKIVADHFGTDHHLLNVEADATGVIPNVVWHLDEPLSDAATIPTYLMSEATKKEVSVILSGEGADEQLGGYDKYKAVYYPYLWRNFCPSPVFRLFSNLLTGYPRTYRAMEYLGKIHDLPEAYLRFASVFLPEERKQLIRSSFTHKTGENGGLEIVKKYLGGPGDFLNKLLLLDLKTWLPDDLLLKNDKMTMAHAVEARIPFLDHKLVEFLMTVPGSLKLKWFREKYLLRKGMEGIVPDAIIKRKKQGFSVPIHNWIKDDLRHMTLDLLSRRNMDAVGVINHDFVKDLAEKDLRNPYPLRQFWTVFSFLAWHRYFLKRSH